jgi:hypothetical protein
MEINDYRFGSITVGGEVYKADLIILPDRIITSWWRRSGHSLVPEDLEEVVKAAPEVLVVGAGAAGVMRVPEETLRYLQERGIEVVVLRTGEACLRFNELRATRRAAAALHLTC